MKSDTLKRSVTYLKPFVYERFRRKVTLLRFFMILFEHWISRDSKIEYHFCLQYQKV